jgi:hypothetical protein
MSGAMPVLRRMPSWRAQEKLTFNNNNNNNNNNNSLAFLCASANEFSASSLI